MYSRTISKLNQLGSCVLFNYKSIDIINSLLTETEDILKSPNMNKMKTFRHHNAITTQYDHSVAVAYISLWLARTLHIRVDERSLLRGALLHDYFLYDRQAKNVSLKEHNKDHPKIALNNACRDFTLNKIEKDIIEKHMFPQITHARPLYRESVLVGTADKICGVIGAILPITFVLTPDKTIEKIILC